MQEDAVPDQNTFHVNMPLPIRNLLMGRGLHVAEAGRLATFAAWKPPRGPPCRPPPPIVDERRRGVVELGVSNVVEQLGNKKRLAGYLALHGLSAWAPLTVHNFTDFCKDSADPDGKEPSGSTLWFLKHASLERNEGVSVFLGKAACFEAWRALPESERENYIAQMEVPNVILNREGCKMTLRVYVVLLAESNHIAAVHCHNRTCHAPSTWAAARKEFVCRSHPLPYDPADPNCARHIHSTIGKFEGVEGLLGSQWSRRNEVWPAICHLLKECLLPFLSAFALAHNDVQNTSSGAGALSCELLGVDLLVDSDLRPWLIEVNQSPQLMPVRNNHAATVQREAVVEDLLSLLVDPILGTRDEAMESCRHFSSDKYGKAWDWLLVPADSTSEV